jgi:type VI secretion system protein
MPLSLTITAAKGGDRQSRTLTNGTLSIGRAAGNDWVLADPEQHLSRTHCMIAFEGGQYWITDLSTNGLLVNGAREPTSRGTRLVLTDGDTIRFGGYVLAVAEVAGGVARGGAADPFAVENPLDADPLADPLGVPGSAGFAHPLAHRPPSLRTEDPFDSVAPHDAGGDDDADLFRGRTPLEEWKGPAQPDHAAAGSHAFSAPKPLTPVNLADIDFDELLGDVMPGPAAPPRAEPPRPDPARSEPRRPEPPRPAAPPPPPAATADPFDDLLDDAPKPPPPRPVAAPPPAPAVQAAPPPAAAAAAPPAAPAALLAAFLEGAGVNRRDLQVADQEAAMRAIGALFRALVAGTREVLMSRAEIKHEMRVEQTMIRAQDNNPLKFSISAEEAVLALLRPDRPGYKPPLASVEEAFSDMRSHEMAVMAGMQTGLIALLKRFDPAGLEARLQRGMLDGILPVARRARFWELFCATYKDIAREAEDDFHAVFGRDFARAYDAQVRKL